MTVKFREREKNKNFECSYQNIQSDDITPKFNNKLYNIYTHTLEYSIQLMNITQRVT